MPHAMTRFGQFKEHMSSTNRDLGDIMLGIEDAPFLFCPCEIECRAISNELESLLRKNSHDKFQGTSLEHFRQELVTWHSENDLPRINTSSSNNWRIFVVKTKPPCELTLRQVCRGKDRYLLIQGSAVKTLNFNTSTICFVIPHGIAPQCVNFAS